MLQESHIYIHTRGFFKYKHVIRLGIMYTSTGLHCFGLAENEYSIGYNKLMISPSVAVVFT